jgi:predicted MFS family arabinose efflux permease
LLLIRGRLNAERSAERPHLLAEMREGVSWLWQHPFLRTCALLVAGSNGMFQALVLTLIVLAQSRGAGPAEIGLMLGGFGAGGLLGAAVAPWLQSHLSPRLIVVGANWVWAALTPLILLAPNSLVLAVILGGMAVVSPLWNVVIGAYELRLTPDALLGRVMSVATLVSAGSIPLGSLAAGWLLEVVGPVTTTLVLSGWMLLIAMAATVSRSVRQAPRLDGITTAGYV